MEARCIELMPQLILNLCCFWHTSLYTCGSIRAHSCERVARLQQPQRHHKAEQMMRSFKPFCDIAEQPANSPCAFQSTVEFPMSTDPNTNSNTNTN
eukprot:399309-Amphidinium_carterae.1